MKTDCRLKVTAANVEEARALSQHGKGRERWLELRAGESNWTTPALAGLSDLCETYRKALGELGHELPRRRAQLRIWPQARGQAIGALKLVMERGLLDRGARSWTNARWRFPGMLLREKYDFEREPRRCGGARRGGLFE